MAEPVGPVERPFFLPTETPGHCYTVLHAPLEAVGAVILVPPFAEEKKAAQRALVDAARAFADAGWLAVRFDFRGTGDSTGDHGHVDLAAWLTDLRAVLAAVRDLVPNLPVELVGVRFGAALAWLAAVDEPVDGLVLWEPVLSGATYMRQNRQRSQLRRELTAGEGPAETGGGAFGAFDFDGFAVSAALHEQMAAVDLLAGTLPQCRRAQVLQVSGSPRLKPPLVELAARLTAADIPNELDNVAVEAFWSAIGLVDTAPVHERTLAWLTAPAEARPLPLSDLAAIADVAPGVVTEALSFVSGDQRVHGVLYRPGGPVDRAVVLLHGWSGYRIGPAGLLTRAARELAAAGYAAYTFDFRGRGESEWAVSEASLNSMIRDATRALPVIAEHTGATRFTLLGLCSGAEVAIGASLADPRVDSLVLWSAPVFSGNFDFARRARRSRAMLAGYWRKLWLAETWRKLLGGRLNWRFILRALGGGRSAEDAGVVDKAPETATQMTAFEAFGGRLLLVWGANDPETEPSRQFYEEFGQRTGMAHQVHLVDGANHNFYALAWQRQVLDITLAWLTERTEQ